MYKTTVYVSGPDFIIFKKKRRLAGINQTKEDNSWNFIWAESAKHCRSYGKKNYALADNAGIWDQDERPMGHTKYRIICAKDEKTAVSIFNTNRSVKEFKSDAGRIAQFSLNGANFKIVETKVVKKKKKIKKKEKKINIDDNKIVAASSGTGFFISRTGHIITNNHVIEGCSNTKVNFKGNDIEAKVIARDQINDLAILKSKITPKRVFAVSDEDVSLLQDVIVAGFPLGKRVSAAIKIHKGSVSALAGFGDNYSNFQTDATINQGNSGGPVIDKNGNIVGVAVALMPVEKGQNIFFAIKSSTLKTFVKSNSLNFLPSSKRPMTNKDLGNLITESTVFLECWMTVAKIKQLIALEENRKAFYKSFKN